MVMPQGIRAGRRLAQRRMKDEWVVYRLGKKELDHTTGEYTQPTTTVYIGPGKLQSFESYESKPEAGAHQFVEMRPHLHLPVSTSGDVAVDDVAVRTACPYNPDLVDTEVRIAGTPSGHKTAATSNRFPVSEIVA